VSYVAGLPLGPKGYQYSNTNYILAEMIIERVARDSYADQLMKRIIIPLRLRSLCYAPCTCPAADAARMPTLYWFDSSVPQLKSLMGKPVPPLALTWAQGAGGIVSSLQDMTTWDRALYQGQELPARQQRQLESLVSTTTGEPIRSTTLADSDGYGLGVAQETNGPTGTELTNWPPGTVWLYEGGTLGSAVLHVYFPRSGLIIALAVNSSLEDNELNNLVGAAYQTLQKAGAVHES
jgi:D-alanyl-D-alanine carboxypeptidase